MDATSILDGRTQHLPNYSYKLLGGPNHNGYGLDTHFDDNTGIDESKMSVRFLYADGNRRDGVGDLLDVHGIKLDRHRKNPVILYDHGKSVSYPVAIAEDPETKKYTIEIDPIAKQAWATGFFYQGKGASGIGLDKEYDHALLCHQLFDLIVKRYIRSGSVGYSVLKAYPLAPDYQTGAPQGMHLQEVLMLEASVVVMPANADTVRKSLDYPSAREILCLNGVCGKPLSPVLVKSLQPYAEPRKAQMGWEAKGAFWPEKDGDNHPLFKTPGLTSHEIDEQHVRILKNETISGKDDQAAIEPLLFDEEETKALKKPSRDAETSKSREARLEQARLEAIGLGRSKDAAEISKVLESATKVGEQFKAPSQQRGAKAIERGHRRTYDDIRQKYLVGMVGTSDTSEADRTSREGFRNALREASASQPANEVVTPLAGSVKEEKGFGFRDPEGEKLSRDLLERKGGSIQWNSTHNEELPSHIDVAASQISKEFFGKPKHDFNAYDVRFNRDGSKDHFHALSFYGHVGSGEEIPENVIYDKFVDHSIHPLSINTAPGYLHTVIHEHEPAPAKEGKAMPTQDQEAPKPSAASVQSATQPHIANSYAEGKAPSIKSLRAKYKAHRPLVTGDRVRIATASPGNIPTGEVADVLPGGFSTVRRHYKDEVGNNTGERLTGHPDDTLEILGEKAHRAPVIGDRVTFKTPVDKPPQYTGVVSSIHEGSGDVIVTSRTKDPAGNDEMDYAYINRVPRSSVTLQSDKGIKSLHPDTHRIAKAVLADPSDHVGISALADSLEEQGHTDYADHLRGAGITEHEARYRDEFIARRGTAMASHILAGHPLPKKGDRVTTNYASDLFSPGIVTGVSHRVLGETSEHNDSLPYIRLQGWRGSDRINGGRMLSNIRAHQDPEESTTNTRDIKSLRAKYNQKTINQRAAKLAGDVTQDLASPDTAPSDVESFLRNHQALLGIKQEDLEDTVREARGVIDPASTRQVKAIRHQAAKEAGGWAQEATNTERRPGRIRTTIRSLNRHTEERNHVADADVQDTIEEGLNVLDPTATRNVKAIDERALQRSLRHYRQERLNRPDNPSDAATNAGHREASLEAAMPVYFDTELLGSDRADTVDAMYEAADAEERQRGLDPNFGGPFQKEMRRLKALLQGFIKAIPEEQDLNYKCCGKSLCVCGLKILPDNSREGEVSIKAIDPTALNQAVQAGDNVRDRLASARNVHMDEAVLDELYKRVSRVNLVHSDVDMADDYEDTFHATNAAMDDPNMGSVALDRKDPANPKPVIPIHHRKKAVERVVAKEGALAANQALQHIPDNAHTHDERAAVRDIAIADHVIGANDQGRLRNHDVVDTIRAARQSRRSYLPRPTTKPQNKGLSKTKALPQDIHHLARAILHPDPKVHAGARDALADILEEHGHELASKYVKEPPLNPTDRYYYLSDDEVDSLPVPDLEGVSTFPVSHGLPDDDNAKYVARHIVRTGDVPEVPDSDVHKQFIADEDYPGNRLAHGIYNRVRDTAHQHGLDEDAHHLGALALTRAMRNYNPGRGSSRQAASAHTAAQQAMLHTEGEITRRGTEEHKSLPSKEETKPQDKPQEPPTPEEAAALKAAYHGEVADAVNASHARRDERRPDLKESANKGKAARDRAVRPRLKSLRAKYKNRYANGDPIQPGDEVTFRTTQRQRDFGHPNRVEAVVNDVMSDGGGRDVIVDDGIHNFNIDADQIIEPNRE